MFDFFSDKDVKLPTLRRKMSRVFSKFTKCKKPQGLDSPNFFFIFSNREIKYA